MDELALKVVRDYIEEMKAPEQGYELFVVWKCKALQNEKYLISTTWPAMTYFELTYNGDLAEWYLDVYRKMDNKRIEL